MKFNDAMEEYLLASRQKGLRKGTIDSYRWYLEHMGRWLAEHGCEDVEALNVRTVRRWGAELHEGRQLTTTRGGFAAARGLFRWLLQEEILKLDLAASLAMPKPPEVEQRTISQDEVGRLFHACGEPLHEEEAGDQALALAARNVALVAVLFDSMLRAAELCALRVQDVDLEKGLLRVRSGKGGKGRSAPIGPDAMFALKVWLPQRASPAVRLAPGCDSLFVSLGGLTPGKHLTVPGLRLILRRLGERAGIEGVCPHAFRRGGAVAATLAGAPSRLVQVWGGWSNIKMVELYTRTLRNDPEALGLFKRYAPLSSVHQGLGWLLSRLAGKPGAAKRRLRKGRMAKRKPNIRWNGRRGQDGVML